MRAGHRLAELKADSIWKGQGSAGPDGRASAPTGKAAKQRDHDKSEARRKAAQSAEVHKANTATEPPMMTNAEIAAHNAEVKAARSAPEAPGRAPEPDQEETITPGQYRDAFGMRVSSIRDIASAIEHYAQFGTPTSSMIAELRAVVPLIEALAQKLEAQQAEGTSPSTGPGGKVVH